MSSIIYYKNTCKAFQQMKSLYLFTSVIILPIIMHLLRVAREAGTSHVKSMGILYLETDGLRKLEMFQISLNSNKLK